MKKWMGRLVLAGGSAFALLLACELILRAASALEQRRGGDLAARLARSAARPLDAAGGEFNMTGLVQASEYADIVYELKPNLHGSFQGRPVRTNSRGLRDKEYDLEKPAGTFRIAGLGDSVMFGWGVGQGECYLDVLEERLNALPDARRFELLNFAVPGYNTAIEVAVFEHKALSYDPDMVIIHFINNDLGVPLFMERPRRALSLRRSALLDLVRLYRNPHADVHRRLVGYRLEDLDEREKKRVHQAYWHMVGEEGFRRAMRRLADLTRPRNIPVVIIQGSATDRQKEMLANAAAEHGFRLLDIAPYTDAYVAKHGIPDNRDARRKALWVSERDRHPNAAAHTIYADGLEDVMRKMGIFGGEETLRTGKDPNER